MMKDSGHSIKTSEQQDEIHHGFQYLQFENRVLKIESDSAGIIRIAPAEISTAEQPDDFTRCASEELSEYLMRKRKQFDVPLSLTGTAFQIQVWNALRSIPCGCTCSYGELAKMIGRADAFRAAGNAAGKNPVMILVPCHRLIRADHRMGGFAWGAEWKQFLHEIEGIRL